MASGQWLVKQYSITQPLQFLNASRMFTVHVIVVSIERSGVFKKKNGADKHQMYSECTVELSAAYRFICLPWAKDSLAASVTAKVFKPSA